MADSPRGLDLFCGAIVVKSSSANTLCILRRRGRSAAAYEEILLAALCSTACSRLAQETGLPGVWSRIRGSHQSRCKSAALFEAMRQTPQCQEHQGLADGKSRGHEEIQPGAQSQESGRLDREASLGATTNHRVARRCLHSVRRSKSQLAPRRFHSHDQGVPLSASAPLRLRKQAQGSVSYPLRQSSLRTNAYRPNRGYRHHAVRKAAR